MLTPEQSYIKSLSKKYLSDFKVKVSGRLLISNEIANRDISDYSYTTRKDFKDYELKGGKTELEMFYWLSHSKFIDVDETLAYNEFYKIDIEYHHKNKTSAERKIKNAIEKFRLEFRESDFKYFRFADRKKVSDDNVVKWQIVIVDFKNVSTTNTPDFIAQSDFGDISEEIIEDATILALPELYDDYEVKIHHHHLRSAFHRNKYWTIHSGNITRSTTIPFKNWTEQYESNRITILIKDLTDREFFSAKKRIERDIEKLHSAFEVEGLKFEKDFPIFSRPSYGTKGYISLSYLLIDTDKIWRLSL